MALNVYICVSVMVLMSLCVCMLSLKGSDGSGRGVMKHACICEGCDSRGGVG